MAQALFDFSRLTPDERIDLAEELWDSLAEDQAPAMTEAQGEELDRRLAAYREDRDPGRPWEEVLREIEESGE
jgi:putative addiction module component (TIGR02574 family)